MNFFSWRIVGLGTLWLGLSVGASIAFSGTNQHKQVTVAAVPDWVRQCEWQMPARAVTNQTSEGSSYLLYENQEHPQRQETFLRIIKSMENEAGVQDSGNLSFGFDPNFQQLILHCVRIHRGGRVLERLEEKKLKVIQREPGLGSHLLTGRQTVLVLVEDLRVGDALEYAYTTRGENPILGGHFATRFTVQSSVAIGKQRVRVVWDSQDRLEMRQHLLEMPPHKAPFGKGTEYVWDFDAVTPIQWEDYQPAGYEPYPYVEFSDFDDWSKVVDWAVPLYEVTHTNLTQEFRELIDRWRLQGTNDEQRVRQALQFVQDELRYTGLELGPDSYRPAPPMETLAKRFGDCKGKVMLFCLMLRQLGVEAYPALVNTYKREATSNRLPSPFAFNHVIVKASLNGRDVWLDPTLSHQGGTLWQRHLPRYGKALVVRAGNKALEAVPPSPAGVGKQIVNSHFAIKDYDSQVKLSVQTSYQGADADDMRENLARSDLKDLAKDYLNYYARYYPVITNTETISVRDNREVNLITVSEAYQIHNHWRQNDSKRRQEASFYAESMEGFLINPQTRLRKMPLRMSYPQRREQHVRVDLPLDRWDLPAYLNDIEHDAFKFKYRREFSGSTVIFHYECETKAPEVSAADVAGYLAKRKEMESLLGDTLFRPDNRSSTLIARVNWLMIAIASLILCLTLGGAFWFWRRLLRVPPAFEGSTPPVLDVEPGSPSGLGGWLILVAIGLFTRPLLILGAFVTGWDGYFSMEVWRLCAVPGGDNYHPMYAPVLIFEVLGNLVMLAMNLLCIALFFGRRRMFPRAFIALLVVSAIVLIADHLLSAQLPTVQAAADSKSSREVFRAIFGGAIWIAYALHSKRVKATFIR
jgi:hypothetical protein